MADLSLAALGAKPQVAPSVADLGRYGPRVLPSNYSTSLPLMDEFQFRNWVANNRVPFDPNQPVSDYDMRGFYQAAAQGQPNMAASVNPIDNQIHYPDRFKTPQHNSFSEESQWAGPNAPRWINDAQLALPSGRVVFDERQR